MKIFSEKIFTLKMLVASLFMLSSLHIFGQNASARNVFGNRLLQSLKSVEYYNGNSDEREEYVFTYNGSGQVTKIDVSYTSGFEETYTFDYTPGTINGEAYHVLMICVDNDGEEAETEKCYLRLNKNNFIEYCYEELTCVGDEDIDVDIWNFEYNEDGQLRKMSRSSDGYYELVEGTYTNGDLTSVKETSDGDIYSYTISYTSSAVPTPIDNSDKINFMEGFGFDLEELSVAYYAGMIGNPSKHLPISCVNFGETETFTWEFSADKTQTFMNCYYEGKYESQNIFTWLTSSTGISSINAASENASRVYGIDGTLRQRPQRGINIIDGKKVWKKR